MKMKLQIKDMFKAYGDLQVMKGFNIDFSAAGIHCVFGPSGCGKTTLLNILTGIDRADRGEVSGFKDKTFSCIFQEDRLLPWSTVEENIQFVLESCREKREIQDNVDRYLALVDLVRFKDCYPEQLSGGMKQRASIARAFAYGGDVLLMDEPFKGLHFELKKDLMDYLIQYWNQKSQFFIFITHDIEEALYMADHIHILEGPPLQLKNQITIQIHQNQRAQQKREMEVYRELLLGKP